MFKKCKSRSAADQVRLCNSIEIMMVIGILIMAVLTIVDIIHGQPIDNSRTSLICLYMCILSLNICNKKKALEILEADNDYQK